MQTIQGSLSPTVVGSMIKERLQHVMKEHVHGASLVHTPSVEHRSLFVKVGDDVHA